MFKFCFILIFFFNFIFLFSQGSHFQWEGTTNAPNAHIRVFSDGRIFLFAADNSGRANISYFRPSMHDSILVTSIGYKPLKLSCLELLKINEILLEEDIFSFNEIVVSPTISRRTRTIRLGNTSAFAPFSTNIIFEWQYVLYIPYNHQAGKILKIRYYMGGRLFTDMNFMSVRPFRVRLYEKDSFNQTVGKDLLNDFLIVSHISNYGWLEVDISNYNISMPVNGIFVGFEILPSDYYIDNYFISGPSINHSLGYSLTNSVSFGITRSNRRNRIEQWEFHPRWQLWLLDTRLSDFNFLINIEVERK